MTGLSRIGKWGICCQRDAIPRWWSSRGGVGRCDGWRRILVGRRWMWVEVRRHNGRGTELIVVLMIGRMLYGRMPYGCIMHGYMLRYGRMMYGSKLVLKVLMTSSSVIAMYTLCLMLVLVLVLFIFLFLLPFVLVLSGI
jgi:hypothetical protein